MIYLTALLFLAGLGIAFTGMLGMGWGWIIGGAVITLVSGVFWGIAPRSGEMEH
ncbi:hypothetical protein ACQUQP_15875 [Marinobacterium sp. YM272]|uniref:hypothetical protein n=1 Tax=Marinobacterium sp. YM272 TaxID=3421654 RepID=UPI003D7F6C70